MTDSPGRGFEQVEKRDSWEWNQELSREPAWGGSMRLDGCRVLDLTRLLPGPYATQLLCDAGAGVIKVEDTDRGDYAREIPPYSERGVGALFDAVNRGKRSVAIDLKSE